MSLTREVDELAVRLDLIRAIREAGGESEFAKRHKIRLGLVCETARGDRSPGHFILQALGYDTITRYVKSTP